VSVRILAERAWFANASYSMSSIYRASFVSPYQRIYRVVARIPPGRVATYGQIAGLAGIPRGARQVGYALAALRDGADRVPWHRVLNARGEITTRFEPEFKELQRELLSREGIEFDANGRVSLQRYQWRGVDSSPPAQRARR
jgi:methylated-DNA-protein-cysteine methyltransferase-like protein